MKIKVYGCSDDLIEIEGDISLEFSAYDNRARILAFGDGTLLRIIYDEDGIWRINRLFEGTAQFTHTQGDIEKDINDIVTLEGDLKWATCGLQY